MKAAHLKFGCNAGAATLAAALCALLLSAPAGAANKKPPTIKDLDSQQIDVNTDPPKNVDANKTMDSYRRFLDLNAGDAALARRGAAASGRLEPRKLRI